MPKKRIDLDSLDQNQSMSKIAFEKELKKYQLELLNLQLKLKAYKTEYVKEKSIGKQQEKLIKGYEQVFQYLSKRKETLKNERDMMKTQNYEQLLSKVKSDYEVELKEIR